MTGSLKAKEKHAKRAIFREEISRMAYPPREHEAAMYAEIATLPRVFVPTRRVPHMLPNDCHTNCAYFCLANTDYIPVHGWVIDGLGRALVHTVVQHRTTGQYMCITPNPVIDIPGIPFTPDPDIVVPCFYDGDPIPEPCPVISRKGIALGRGVREDPEQYIELVRRSLKRLRK